MNDADASEGRSDPTGEVSIAIEGGIAAGATFTTSPSPSPSLQVSSITFSEDLGSSSSEEEDDDDDLSGDRRANNRDGKSLNRGSIELLHRSQSISDWRASLDKRQGVPQRPALSRRASFPRRVDGGSTAIRLRRADAALMQQALVRPPSIFHTKAEMLAMKNLSLEVQSREDLNSVARSLENNASSSAVARQGSVVKAAMAGLHKISSRLLLSIPESTGKSIVSRFARELEAQPLFDVQLNAEDGAKRTILHGDPDYREGLELALSSALMHCNVQVQSTFSKRGKNQGE